MEIQVGCAKVTKYGSRESGDTLEFVERPTGGVSIVLADGLTSGREAKSVSVSVVRRVIGLLAEGVRDGAAARAASDLLFAEGNGAVSAHLNIISADLETSTLVISRNNPVPVFVAQRYRIECLNTESTAIGVSREVRPVISEIALETGTTIVTYTDGLMNAGERIGQPIDVCTLLESLLEDQEPRSQDIADTILAEAIRLDGGRPVDDMSIVVLRVLAGVRDDIRRISVQFPVPVKNDDPAD